MRLAPPSYVTFTFQNRGSMTWTAGEVTLAPTPRDAASDLCDPSWPRARARRAWTRDTAPGAQGTFHVRLMAPPTRRAGHAPASGWSPGSHWFSDPGQNGPADDAICHEIDIVPASAPYGGGGTADLSDGGVGFRAVEDGGVGDTSMASTQPFSAHALTSSCSIGRGTPSPIAPALLLGAVGIWLRRRPSSSLRDA